MPANYTCPLCLEDYSKDVQIFTRVLEPEQVVAMHMAKCVMQHKADLLDTFCQEWTQKLQTGVDNAEAMVTLTLLYADWQKHTAHTK